MSDWSEVKPSHHVVAAEEFFAAVTCVRTVAVSVSVVFFWACKDSVSARVCVALFDARRSHTRASLT